MTSPIKQMNCLSPPAAEGGSYARMKLLFGAVCDQPHETHARILGENAATPAEIVRVLAMLELDRSTPHPTLNNASKTTDKAPLWQSSNPVANMLTMMSQPGDINRSGMLLDAWKIADCIGQGGMGVVYRAERSDGQFQQTVAIKFLTGLATTRASARLAAERQMLAALEHPNIARIIDSGTTDLGVPYIVMDYVNGAAINVACRQRQASLRDVAQFMVAVCDAVSYAHQMLRLHCDLKPANIMVDQAGRIKLLDFGIAELITLPVQMAHELSAAQTARTESAASTTRQLRDHAFTPRYSSPEQRAGKPLSTATDIYSLGRVYDELIEGSSTTTRNTPLSRQLRIESMSIADKASAETIEARYRTVADMRADLIRMLQTESVRAVDGGIAYHIGKLIIRRWAMTVALTILVVGGLVFTHSLVRERDRALKAETLAAAELRRAQSAEDSARAERDRAQVSELRAREGAIAAREAREAAIVERDRAVRAERFSLQEQKRALRAELQAQLESANTREARDFLYSLFDGADPTRGGRALVTAADLLAKGRERVRMLPEEQRELKSNMLTVLARIHENIGLIPDARLLYQNVIDIESDPLHGRLAEHANALSKLAILQYNGLMHAAAMESAQQMMTIRRKLYRADSAEMADAQNTLGLVLSGNFKEEEATVQFEASLATRRRLQGDNIEKSEDVAATLHNMGLHFARFGKLQQAEPKYRESLEIKRALFGKRHPKIANTLEQLVSLLTKQQRFAEALTLQHESYLSRVEMHGPHSNQVAIADSEYGSLLQDMGRYAEAEKHYLASLANPVRAAEADGKRAVSYALPANNLATLYEDIGNLTGAEYWYRVSLETRRARLPDDDMTVARALHNLGRLLSSMGRNDEALNLLLKAHSTRLAKVGNMHAETQDTALAIANLYAQQGDLSLAKQWLARADELIVSQRTSRLLAKRRAEALIADADADNANTGSAHAGLKIWESRARIAKEKIGANHVLTLRAILDYAVALSSAGLGDEAVRQVGDIPKETEAKLAPNAPDRARLLRFRSAQVLQPAVR